jgi:2-oxoisovalerate dehydrogenase E1 component
VVCTGDGTTSEGEFWEALNTACNLKLPVLFLVEDNEYAISVPVEVQTAGGSISDLLTGFPNLKIVRCDGTDVVDSWEKSAEAVAWCRSGQGPALLHAKTVRPYSHSMSDDERMYRPAANSRSRRPGIPWSGPGAPAGRGDRRRGRARRARGRVEAEVARAADEALEHPQPDPSTAMKWLFSEEVDPTSSDFDTEDAPDLRRRPGSSPWWTS